MDAPSATQRADGRWDVTVPVAAKKFYATEEGVETETPLAERMEVGRFTAEPGGDAFDESDVILMERQPIRSGSQVLKFVTAKRPAFAGADPYNYYIDRDSADNVLPSQRNRRSDARYSSFIFRARAMTFARPPTASFE